jgi:hypothetical protein
MSNKIRNKRETPITSNGEAGLVVDTYDEGSSSPTHISRSLETSLMVEIELKI